MPELTRPKKLILIAAPFPALASFKIWASSDPGLHGLLLAAGGLFVYCLLILAMALRWDRPSYLDWATTVYFGAAFAGLVLWPKIVGRVFSQYAVTGIFACLLAAAFIPPLMGKPPFTVHYAQKSTPRMFWNNPVFLRINTVMTHVWSAIFFVCLLVSLYPSVVTRAIVPIGLIVAVGIPFNLRYPDVYLKRLGLPTRADQRRMAAQETHAPEPEK